MKHSTGSNKEVDRAGLLLVGLSFNSSLCPMEPSMGHADPTGALGVVDSRTRVTAPQHGKLYPTCQSLHSAILDSSLL